MIHLLHIPEMGSASQSQNADLTIVGGGLAGILALWFLKSRFPTKKIILLEKSDALAGNHTWCFHHADVPENCWFWLTPLVSKSWDQHSVHFPGFERILNSKYYAIKSDDLREKTMHKFADSIFLNQDKIPDHCPLLITTGWPALENKNNFAYQKFIGWDVKLREPHNLNHAILKENRVEQTDGYRFFYCLPWNLDSLLIEDTYYSTNPELKPRHEGIQEFADSKGWQIESILKKERGVLPLPLWPDAFTNTKKNAHVEIYLGAAANWCQPTSGFTTPMLFQAFSEIQKCESWNFENWRLQIINLEKSWQKRFSFYCLLNRMMFFAAKPEKRYIILKRFYRLNQNLIERFYSLKLTKSDCIRILSGIPPVPIFKALQAAFRSRGQ